MSPDFDRAAAAALELLAEKKITQTPIDALSLLLDFPRVRVISFSRMASEAGEKRGDLVPLFGENQDAATFNLVSPIEGVDYVVVYNRFLTVDVVMRGIARELGHIVLGHDGQTRPADVRLAEAKCFAHHLLSPRPIIRILQESGAPLTQNVLSDTTGCSGQCVDELRTIPGVRVPGKLNETVRDLFSRGINEYLRFHRDCGAPDNSPVLDLGSFMDGYVE